MNVAMSKGLSSTAGLIAVAVSLLLALILTVISLGTFSGGSGSGSTGILSKSTAEQQIQLCAEGRDSSYGDPPSQAQQAACDDEIADQAGVVVEPALRSCRPRPLLATRCPASPRADRPGGEPLIPTSP